MKLVARALATAGIAAAVLLPVATPASAAPATRPPIGEGTFYCETDRDGCLATMELYRNTGYVVGDLYEQKYVPGGPTYYSFYYASPGVRPGSSGSNRLD